uniref:Ig-like domain-containing protein n=1 Tax=Callorhinchus milii TaxID=7868 RepID=A0A4W3H3N3_CALMI
MNLPQILLCHFCLKGSQSPSLVQSPRFVNVREGDMAWLQCSMEKADVSNKKIFWYRVHPRQRRQFILSHDTSDRITVPEGSPQRFQPSRVTSNNTYILILRRVTVSDAAVYHCCVWGDVCGDGTRLNVTTPQMSSGALCLQDHERFRQAIGKAVSAGRCVCDPRSQSEDITKRSRGEVRRNVFTQRVVGIWNDPPERAVTSDLITAFKRELDRYRGKTGLQVMGRKLVSGVNKSQLLCQRAAQTQWAEWPPSVP